MSDTDGRNRCPAQGLGQRLDDFFQDAAGGSYIRVGNGSADHLRF
jgi:hypothetical protein